MPQFIFFYLGGEYPTNPAEGQKHFEEYQQWLMSLGDSVVSPAVPFKNTHTIKHDGNANPGSLTGMSGISIMRMNSIDEALAAAKTCPFLKIKGTLEVAEMVDMTQSPEEMKNDCMN